ncbi:hypothetical protein H6CHR_03212 [Variovorax sp. PBL-H6]|uniref:hypothetical protein n=1 Tax=Variovorax sp. PBL-H6 TaxID=434009 RepID=UPI0013194B5F|nr:hypothetical protein [Variovorax sp. PBL-H6]VTU29523.1 hypothetical protein H6CHR_03212 [Variovorax sp. PBL-H6]
MPKLSASDKAFRRACAVAVLNGIWTKHVDTILNADKDEYALAIRSASRMAYQQADEMLRRERAEEA